MLSTFFKLQTTRTTYCASFAGPYWDEFTDWLAQCGFHNEIICRYLPGVKEFASWVEATYGNLTSLPANALNQFRDYLVKCGRLRHSKGQHSVHYLGAQHFVEFLQIRHGIIGTETPLQATKPALLGLFEHWMQAHRGVRFSTLRNYQLHSVELLSSLGEYPDQFTAGALYTYILKYARGRSHALAKKRLTAIRMFVRFLITTGRCQPGLEAALPTLAEYR